MKKWFQILLFSFFTEFTYGQQVLNLWNFNTAVLPDNNLNTGSQDAFMGGSTAHLVGSASPSSTNPYNEGSDNDYFSTSLDNTGWNIRNFPALGTGNKTAGIFFPCNTTGFQNLIFKYDEKHSNSSPNTTVVQYNPDTLNVNGWVDIQTNSIVALSYATTWFTRIVDFSSIPAVNNQPRFAVRVVAAFDPAVGNYAATLNQTTASYNPTGGTIRFDMARFTGKPISGCTYPTTQATNPILVTTANNQIDFTFERGNGDSVIIVCREAYAVNEFPHSGMTYAANSQMGLGNQIGSGNFVVYKSNLVGKNSVRVTGLTAGKVYYFSAFEFTNQHCYKIDPLYFHWSAGSTVFKPGELLYIGFDTNIPGATSGNDKHFITTLVDIKPGTQFNLTSSRYEAGAPPNVRTNKWYNSGDYIYKDMDVQEFTWNGTSTIAAGSIIAFMNKFSSNNVYDSVMINGVYQPLFFSDSKKGGFNIGTATTKGEQIYITQGCYYPIGEVYTDRYNLLFGHVLFGMSIYTDWVPVTATPGTANTGIAYRSSRVPPEIECLHIANLSDTVGLAYYTGLTNGTKRFLKLGVNTSANWKWRVGDSLLNITEQYVTPYSGNIGRPYTITASVNTDGSWTGDADTDWFNCNNWEGNYVPDSRTDVIVNTGAPHYPVITKFASCKSIQINNSATVNIANDVILEVGKDK
jgi:hypothetical protein